MPVPIQLTDLFDLRHLGLVDLLVLAAVVLTVVGALRSRRGVLGTVGAVLGTLTLAWLVTVGVSVWGPADAAHAVRDSSFGTALPVPTQAIAELRRDS